MSHTKRNTAFYIETVALLLLLLFGTSVLVQVFGRAQQMGQEAKELATAVPLARNVAEVFAIGGDTTELAAMLGTDAYALQDSQVMAFYDREGVPTSLQQAYYVVELTLATGEGTETGTIRVLRDLQVLYTLETESYRGRG